MGVTALLSGVLARAKAVASSLCVIGRGPVAPLWLRDTGRTPAETPALLEGPAGLPCCIQWKTHWSQQHFCLWSMVLRSKLIDSPTGNLLHRQTCPQTWSLLPENNQIINFKILNHCQLPFSCIISDSLSPLSVFCEPRFLLTWHITVGTGGDVAWGAGAGLSRHTACHWVQDQDDGVDKCWVWTN